MYSGTSVSPFKSTIDTPRLVLELHTKSSDEQYQCLIRCLSTPGAIKFISIGNLTSAAEVDKLFIGMQLEWKLLKGHEDSEGLLEQDCIYHIRPKAGYPGAGQLVGFTVLVQQNDGVPPDQGWLLLDEYNGHGYATEAGKGLLNYATSVLGLQNVVAWPKESNLGSVKVAERIGLTRSGQIRDKKTGELRTVFATEGTRWPPLDGMTMPKSRLETVEGG